MGVTRFSVSPLRGIRHTFVWVDGGQIWGRGLQMIGIRYGGGVIEDVCGSMGITRFSIRPMYRHTAYICKGQGLKWGLEMMVRYGRLLFLNTITY